MPVIPRPLLVGLLSLSFMQLQAGAAEAAQKAKPAGAKSQAARATRTALTEKEVKARQLLSYSAQMLEKKKPAEAEVYVRQAMALDPHLPMANSLLGVTLMRQGKYEQAVGSIKLDLLTHPSDRRLQFLLADVYAESGDLAEAMTIYREIAAKSPKEPYLRDGSIYMLVQAQKLLKQKEYAETEKLLRWALELSPNMANIHGGLAYILGQTGKPVEAVAEQTKELQLHPSARTMLELGHYYVAAGKLDDAINTFHKVISLYPKNSEANQARMQVAALKPEQQRQHTAQNLTKAEGADDDYFSFATSEVISKWAPDHFPLRVFIPKDEDAAKVQHYRPQCGQALRESFAEWSDKTEGKVKFKFVDWPETADIVCLWSSDPTKMKFLAEGGECRTRDGLEGIIHADISVLTANPKLHLTEIPVDEIKQTCLHEIGHALGILGHSPDPTDVMFYSAAGGMKSLSDRDVRTIIHLYDPSVKIAACPHPEASQNKIALGRQSYQLMQTGKFEQAAKLLQAALRIDPKYSDTIYSLALCYNVFGVKAYSSGNYRGAIAYLSYAVQLMSPLSGERTLKSAVYSNYILALRRENRSAEADAAQLEMILHTGSGAVSEKPVWVLPPPPKHTQQAAKEPEPVRQDKPGWIVDESHSPEKDTIAPAPAQPDATPVQRPAPSWMNP